MMQQLGRLERVNVRDVWRDEAADFTPWLAREENIQILGETLGIPLEVEAQEKAIGPFRADILCRNVDAATEEWVLIENQLGRTDHTHLGQLITYAAGLEAVTIVWIAAKFTEEHRAALDWLNLITDGRFRFFALEIELWRIGDSAIAPKFNLVCQPNNWSRDLQAIAHNESSDTKKLQFEFWTEFVAHLEQKGYRWGPIPDPKPRRSLSFSMGRSNFWLVTIASTWDSANETWGGEVRVVFVINQENSRAYLEEFRQRQAHLEAQIGAPLVFDEKEGERRCCILVRKSVDLTDRSHWAESMTWLSHHLDRFQACFQPIVKSLYLSESSDTPGTDLPPSAASSESMDG